MTGEPKETSGSFRTELLGFRDEVAPKTAETAALGLFLLGGVAMAIALVATLFQPWSPHGFWTLSPVSPGLVSAWFAAVPLLVVARLLYGRLAVRGVAIGSDGVELSAWRRRRFIAFERVVRVEPDARGVTLHLADGAAVLLPIAKRPIDDASRDLSQLALASTRSRLAARVPRGPLRRRRAHRDRRGPGDEARATGRGGCRHSRPR